MLAACRDAGFTPRPTEVAETSTLVSFVAAGMGVALVPASVRHLRITGATLPSVGRGPATLALAVATRSEEPSPVVRRVLDVVSATMADLDQDLEVLIETNCVLHMS